MNTAVARKPTPPSAPESEEASAQASPVATKLPRVMINGDKIKLMEHGALTWLVIAPAEHTLEQVRDPRYCWHKAHSGDIRVGHTIEIRHALLQYVVQILISDIDTDAQAIIGYHTVRDLTKEELCGPDLSDAVVKFIDGPQRWAVMLGSQIMKSGFDTKSEANAYLDKKQSRGS